MKFKKYTYTLGVVLSGALLPACDSLNEAPTFKNSQSFVAFHGENASIAEAEDGTAVEYKIPVMVVTPSQGKSLTVDFDFESTGTDIAKEGVDFELVNGSKTLTFSQGFGTEYITIRTINDDQFTGTRNLKAKLISNSGNLAWGAESGYKLSIKDDDHPFGWLLGKYSLSGVEIRAGAGEWDAEIMAVDGDVNLFNIKGLVSVGPYAAPYSDANCFIAKFDEEAMVLKLQTGQTLKSWGYGPIRLDGFYGPTGAEAIKEGDFITGNVEVDGSKVTVAIQDEMLYYITEGANAGLYIGGLQSDGVSVPTKLVKK